VKAETALHEAFEEYQVWDSSQSEKNLLRAILRTAMEDLKKGGELARDARRFFIAEDDSYLFSFVSICDQLKVCPKQVLKSLNIDNSYRASLSRNSQEKASKEAA